MSATVLLPHDVAGANAFDDEGFRLVNQAVPGLSAQDPTADPGLVFYALPSVPAMLYAGWREAVESGGEVRFADWLTEGLDCARGPWRYDVTVRAWAAEVGANRVTLVLDPDDRAVRATLEDLLEVPAGTLVPSTAPAPVDPGLVGALGRELEALFPEGGLSAALDRAGVLSLDLTAGDALADIGELSEEVAGRLVAVTAEMAASVQRLGVHLVGDLDRLCWHPNVVDVDTAAGLAVGILAQVAGQGTDSAHASTAEVAAQLADQRAELKARREHLGRLRDANRAPVVQPLDAAPSREILAVLAHRLTARLARRPGARR